MKTIEEKAKAYAEDAFAKALKAPWDEAKQAFADAYLAGAKEALAGQWHYISDNNYPQCDNDVLVAYKSRYTDTIAYGVAAYDDRWYSEDDSIMRDRIFAWMRIPDLKDESE